MMGSMIDNIYSRDEAAEEEVFKRCIFYSYFDCELLNVFFGLTHVYVSWYNNLSIFMKFCMSIIYYINLENSKHISINFQSFVSVVIRSQNLSDG